MRASFAVLALAAVVSASSISKRQLPSCALTCIVGADTGDCGPTDNSCLCKTPAFVDSTYACIAKECQGDDLQTSIDGARALCAAAGVSLTQSVPSPTDSASATDSAPAETPAPSGSATAPVPSGSASVSRPASSRASASSTAAQSGASPTASGAPNGAVSATSVSGMVGALAAVAGFMFAL